MGADGTFTVETAVALARKAHEGQLDKAGLPYIEHPLRVMAMVETEAQQMAAVLHDVLEDTPITADDLRAAGCPEQVVQAVIALSHWDDEPMETYLARVVADPIAIVVKRADIADNSSPHRLGQLDPRLQERLKIKYARSLEFLARHGA